MNYIRKANIHDAPLRKRLHLRHRKDTHPLCHHKYPLNDKVSFEEMQVYPLAQYYINHPESLENIWVYDDEFVKGMIHIEGRKIIELYVDSFFENMGIGTKLIEFAIQTFNVKNLFVLEKNIDAIRFYQRHGFALTKERQLEEGTTEYIVNMER